MPSPNIPHSWALADWPPGVFPNDPAKARWLVRSNRTALMQAGALARVGRQLVIFGARYSRWLEKHSSEVAGYQCPANRNRNTAGSAA